MTHDPVPQNTKKQRRGLWWKIPLGGLALLLLTFAVFRFVVHQRVQNRLNAIRAAGDPITPEELNAWYVTPKGRNAAEVYQQAFEAYVGDKRFEQTLPLLGRLVEMPAPGEVMAEDVAARTVYYIRQNAEALSFLEEAAGLEGCRFPVDFESGPFPSQQYLGQLRHGARLMSFRVVTNIRNQDVGRAVDDCLITLAMARSLDQEPTLISALVGISIQAQAHRQVEHILHTGRATDGQLLALYNAFMEDTCIDWMSRPMSGERCMGIRWFIDPAESLDVKHKKGAVALLKLWWLSGLADLDQNYYLDIMNHYCRLADAPTWPIPPDPNDPPLYYPLSNIFLPALGRATSSVIRIETQRRVLLTAIAAERYRLANRVWPKTLQDLVPEFMDVVPFDIYVDRPLSYRHEGSAIVVYSLGPDQSDQHGRPYDEQGDMSEEKPIDYTVVLGTTVKTLFPVLEDDSDLRWDDEPTDAYLKEIATRGFPKLVPRPLDGRWPEDEDTIDFGWDLDGKQPDLTDTDKVEDESHN